MKKVLAIIISLSMILGVAVTANVAATAENTGSSSSTYRDWEDESLEGVSKSTDVVDFGITSSPTIEGSTKALKVISNNWDEKTGSNYVKIALDAALVANSRDIQFSVASSSNNGNKAHFGIIANGKVYWEQAYVGGGVPYAKDGYASIGVCDSKFVGLKNNEFTGSGAYDSMFKVTKTNLSQVQGIAISPSNYKSQQEVYLDDIKYVGKDDIPSVDLPQQGAVFCDWTGKLNHCKSDSPSGSGMTNISMESAFSVENSYAVINTTGFTFKSYFVQPEIVLNTAQTAAAINQAKAGDGYLYGKIRFKGAANGKGADCGLKYKMYCFANGDWSNSVDIIPDNSIKTSDIGEALIKFDVSRLNGMIPDTLALNIMNANYYDCITFVNCEISPLFASSGDPNVTYPTDPTTSTTSTTSTTTVTNPPVTGDPTVMYGDVNGDGKVNGKDSLSLKMYNAGLNPSPFNEDAADTNGDGKINGKDSRILKRYNAGDISELPYFG